jgi:preprotein translocase subunit SecA
MATQLGGFEKVLRLGEGRRLKRLAEQADYITSLESEFEALSDEQLRGKTAEFRQRIENGATLEELLFEAFAAAREARKRESDQRIFDVQLMGGIVLHEGDIAEMKTGEGKTFVASLALYLNALPTVTLRDGRVLGQGVHLVTVNDYLASRDAEWNRGVYERLGMTVAHIETMQDPAERKLAYEVDITYGTNSEFGFDYLRDNMAPGLDFTVQRGHHFAIVDEVDSILIDEARTPLIISGAPTSAAKVYRDMARVARGLTGAQTKGTKLEDQALQAEYDFLFDEKHKTVSVTESGIEKVERALRIENLYDPTNVQLVNHLNQALKAEALWKRDVDYVVADGEVKIVDEFTGRIMEGRRWSEGLHQAVEAKEGVDIKEENQTVATITLQNYFRLYEKLGGMTGTAKTEEKEFVEIYGLEVVPIPTNVEVARLDQNDLIFKTVEAKFNAAVEDIKERHQRGQPVLVGTIAVETSELVSELLKRQGVPHQVLNAKEHAREAEIIKDAGGVGAVTIATNMAGRGVDIKIDDQVRELGGLYVLGTERHEARRIDNQLRGRSGRQGDPGETRFYLSGQDDLVRLFAGDRIFNIMERFKVPDDQPMEAKILSNQIENAQKKVEEQNFVARKNVLKYDDVMNRQRMVIYEQRREVLEGSDLSEGIKEEWLPEVIANVVRGARRLGPRRARQRDGRALRHRRYRRRARRARARRDRRGVPRRRARRLRRARADVRGRRRGDRRPGRPADPPGRARRRAGRRRHALARAPREHGLHARGHLDALDGPERSARRVPQRGPGDVHRAQPRDPRRGDADPLPPRAHGDPDRRQRAATLRVAGGRGERQRQRRGTADLQPRNGPGCPGDGGEHRPARSAAARWGGSGCDQAGRQVRAGATRPQRPLLVRLGQEVQALPRSLSGALSFLSRQS